MATSASRSVPPRFGRYETLAYIASGGMGAVYVCRLGDKDGFERLFAVKFIHPHLAENEAFARMLRQEARIAARAHHPNVVSIVDVGSHEGVPYLVMDYVEGCTLGDLLRTHRAERPLDHLMAVLHDALNGLHAAHTMLDAEGKPLGLVHRDISPQNLLVGLDGSTRLTDFGVAKANNALHETLPGKIKGKPAYMSPEQISGEEIDARSDLFSLGVVLWNSVTGRNLFDGPSPPATMYNVLKREIPRPSRVGLHPPNWLDDVCAKALQRDPDRRYQSAQDFLSDLRMRALEHGALSSASDVASWVRGTFGDALEARRDHVRRGPSQSRVERLDLSKPVSLTALGALVDDDEADDEELMLDWEELAESTKASSSTVSAIHEVPLTDAEVAAASGDGERGSSRAVWMGAAAVVLLGGVGLWAFAGDSQASGDSTAPAAVVDETEEDDAGKAAAPAPAEPAAPEEPAEDEVLVVEPDADAEEPPEAREAGAEAQPDATPEEPATSKRSRTRRSKRPRPSSAPTKKPAASPKDDTSGKKKSLLDGGKVERNPYVVE